MCEMNEGKIIGKIDMLEKINPGTKETLEGCQTLRKVFSPWIRFGKVEAVWRENGATIFYSKEWFFMSREDFERIENLKHIVTEKKSKYEDLIYIFTRTTHKEIAVYEPGYRLCLNDISIDDVLEMSIQELKEIIEAYIELLAECIKIREEKGEKVERAHKNLEKLQQILDRIEKMLKS